MIAMVTRGLFLESPEKPFRKLLPAHSVKLVFPYVVKGIKINITARFCASRHLHFEDTKKIVSPEVHPKSLGTFEKQAPAYFQEECCAPLAQPLWHLHPQLPLTNCFNFCIEF